MCPTSYVLYDSSDIEKFKQEYDKDKIYILKKNISKTGRVENYKR